MKINNEYILNEGIAYYIDFLNHLRLEELSTSLEKIIQANKDELLELAKHNLKAKISLDKAEEEINKLILNNRGGSRGLHGFIAEFAEEGVTNAYRAFEGMSKLAKVLNDNGPADLNFGKNQVQMKFYDNICKELKQAANYRNMKMMIPKDHVELINKIMNGDEYITFNGNRLTKNTIDRIKLLISEENKARHVTSHTKWLNASKLDYKEVQTKSIRKTLSGIRRDISKKSAERRELINNNTNIGRKNAYIKSLPSLKEANRAATISSIVQGGISLSSKFLQKYQEGKDILTFTDEDWIDCGMSAGDGIMKGGISSYSIYGLTNVCGMSASSAGAISAGTFGIIRLILDYRIGKLNDDDFINLALFNAIDATGAALGACLGQAIIPIPVVGPVIGSIATSIILDIGKQFLSNRERKMIEEYNSKMQHYLNKLDLKYQEIFNEIVEKYKKLGELQNYAFDVQINISLRLEYSVQLARELDVDDSNLLHNISEIDDYFLS